VDSRWRFHRAIRVQAREHRLVAAGAQSNNLIFFGALCFVAASAVQAGTAAWR